MEKMECRSIPREQCNGGQPRQECSTVPRMQCGDPICQPVYWCRKVKCVVTVTAFGIGVIKIGQGSRNNH